MATTSPPRRDSSIASSSTPPTIPSGTTLSTHNPSFASGNATASRPTISSHATRAYSRSSPNHTSPTMPGVAPSPPLAKGTSTAAPSASKSHPRRRKVPHPNNTRLSSTLSVTSNAATPSYTSYATATSHHGARPTLGASTGTGSSSNSSNPTDPYSILSRLKIQTVEEVRQRDSGLVLTYLARNDKKNLFMLFF